MSTEVRTQIGQVVWHQLMATDVERAKRFYTELLGWQIELWKPGEQDETPMISVDGVTHGGFHAAPEGAPSHWLGHVRVESADDASARAERLGGKAVFGPVDMPEIGRFVVIQDPQGAVMSAYTPETEEPAAQGVFLWDELMSTDAEASKLFYTEVFGWTTSEMDMGEMIYTLFERAPGNQVAGLYQKGEDMPGPSMWVPYLATDDVDATTAKAGGLGASVVVPPMDVPTVGRMALLVDSVGALVGLYKPAAA